MARLIEFFVCLVVVGTVLAFGGVEPWAFFPAELLILFAFTLLILSQARQGQINLHIPLWPLLFLLLVGLQLVPFPSNWVRLLDSARSAAFEGAGLPRSSSNWMTLSIYAHDTRLALILFATYLGVFVLAAHLFDSRKRDSLTLKILVALGCFEAVYGVIQYLTGWQKIFTFTKQFDLQEATGTYINRNHYAGMLELVIPIVISLAYHYFHQWTEGLRNLVTHRSSLPGRSALYQCLFFLFISIILGIGLMYSVSRSGILAMVLSVIFMGLLAQIKIRRKAWAFVVLLFLLCVIGYGLWIGLGPVLSRFEQVRAHDFIQTEGRVSIWKDTLRLIGDHPILGSGLGTFGTAFRQYQTSFLDNYVDHAHNDYLEYASETGLLGVALIFLPIFWLLGRMVYSFLTDRSKYRRALVLACVGSTMAMVIHSASDFNLHIPANALIFSVVLGIGYKAAVIEPIADSLDEREIVAPPLKNWTHDFGMIRASSKKG